MQGEEEGAVPLVRVRELAGAVAPATSRRRARLVLLGAWRYGGEEGHARLAQRSPHVVADPAGVPPLERRHRHAVDQDLVMQVIAEREPGAPAPSKLLLLGDLIAFLDLDRREVTVERLQP